MSDTQLLKDLSVLKSGEGIRPGAIEFMQAFDRDVMNRMLESQIPRRFMRDALQANADIHDEVVIRHRPDHPPEPRRTPRIRGNYGEGMFGEFCRQVYNLDPQGRDRHGIEERFNLRMLGRGHFSIVYDCPWDEELVIKVSRGAAHRGEPYSDGWLEFALFILEYQASGGEYNPLLPEVKDLRVFERFYISTMKKYDHTLARITLEAEPQILSMMAGIEKAMRVRRLPTDNVKPDEKYELYAHRLQKELRRRDLRPDDLHHENIMVSFSEMRVVLTDPIGLSSGGRRRMETTVRELGLAA